MYQMGDKVWVAFLNSTEKHVTCPHCFGKMFLTVILGDDSKVTIDCECCRAGYEGSRGYIRSLAWVSGVKLCTISRIEQKWPATVEYGVDGGYIVDHDKVFDTQEKAEKRATELIVEMDQKEVDRIAMKEKIDRSWAWNVSYHRRNIKDHEKQIIYHKSKLAAALTHVKEEKSGT